jgi:hypothetical protein
MRVWDVPVTRLCRAHLLGEHAELHAIWAVWTRGRKGYRHHPEVQRWEGRLAALYRRHAQQVEELEHRGYRHTSPLDPTLAVGAEAQDRFVDPVDRQLELLTAKPCACPLPTVPSGGRGRR